MRAWLVVRILWLAATAITTELTPYACFPWLLGMNVQLSQQVARSQRLRPVLCILPAELSAHARSGGTRPRKALQEIALDVSSGLQRQCRQALPCLHRFVSSKWLKTRVVHQADYDRVATAHRFEWKVRITATRC
jgi:hypothetical protein